MFSIHLTTFIKAPAKLVFDLSRNTTIVRKALEGRKEILTANAASVLLTLSDTITLSAKHLGKTRVMTLMITEMEEAQKFVEEQVKGDLKGFRHEHYFKQVDNGSLLIDLVYMEEPRDAIGGLLGRLFMKRYFEKMLNKRNELIRKYAESDKWRTIMG